MYHFVPIAMPRPIAYSGTSEVGVVAVTTLSQARLVGDWGYRVEPSAFALPPLLAFLAGPCVARRITLIFILGVHYGTGVVVARSTADGISWIDPLHVGVVGAEGAIMNTLAPWFGVSHRVAQGAGSEVGGRARAELREL